MDTRVYLDCAASTPVDPRVVASMEPYFSAIFGNPGSVHAFGREAQAALDMGRQNIARLFGVDFGNVVFTSSATEANNLIIQGAVKMYRKEQGPDHELPHIITSSIEHESILEACRDLEQNSLATVTYAPVNKEGFVDVAVIAGSLRKETVLVSIMYVNNVTGAIQPVEEISKIIKGFKSDKLSPRHQSRYSPKELMYPIFHSDAAQAIDCLEKIGLYDLGMDAVTVSSHKIYGPKGAGALIAGFSFGIGIAPMIMGGMQEFGIRASTQDVPGIVGFSDALKFVREELVQEKKHTKELKNILVKGIISSYPRAVINSCEPCISSVCNISFPGFGLEELLYRFDQQGIAVAAGSACSAKVLGPSHVLVAMGLDEPLTTSAIRFSFGKFITREAMHYCVERIPLILAR